VYLKVLNSRKGISPVISEIILAAAVLTVGSAVWYFSLGYCSITSDYYISDTLELLNTVIERYTVEKVSNNTDGTSLKIWINNYGEIPIIVDVYAYTANKSGSSFNITIPSGALKMVNIDFSTQPLELGEMVKIKVYSWRQNIVYSDYTAHPPS
jgi:hypothetical protein